MSPQARKPRTRQPPSVEEALTQLQQLARADIAARPPEEHDKFKWARAKRGEWLTLVDEQVDALEDLEAALVADTRFEHMKSRTVAEEAWGFACDAVDRPEEDHISAFVAEHAEDPREQTCFFPVEGLTVHRQVELGGGTLIPAETVEVPDFAIGPHLRQAIGAVIGVPCSGTSNAAMMRRAREVAEHSLRLLRVGLREQNALVDQQLHFGLGVSHWFTETGGGWQTRPGEAIELALNEELLELAMSAPISTLPASGGTNVEQSANRALEWFERAQLATDPLVELLFLFFALEAILGDKSEGLKAEGLALRRAILSHKQSGGFTHPGRTYSLYDQVRSTSVHGEDAPAVADREVRDFSWDVRLSINEFLAFARSESLVKRGRVVKALDSDPVRDDIRARFLPD
jgi:hypothetical protein